MLVFVLGLTVLDLTQWHLGLEEENSYAPDLSPTEAGIVFGCKQQTPNTGDLMQGFISVSCRRWGQAILCLPGCHQGRVGLRTLFSAFLGNGFCPQDQFMVPRGSQDGLTIGSAFGEGRVTGKDQHITFSDSPTFADKDPRGPRGPTAIIQGNLPA